jgi:hypothetical protein
MPQPQTAQSNPWPQQRPPAHVAPQQQSVLGKAAPAAGGLFAPLSIALIIAAVVSILMNFVQYLLLEYFGGITYIPVLLLNILAPLALIVAAATVFLYSYKLYSAIRPNDWTITYALALAASGIFFAIGAYQGLISFRMALGYDVGYGGYNVFGSIIQYLLLIATIALLFITYTRVKNGVSQQAKFFRFSAIVAAVELAWVLFSRFFLGGIYSFLIYNNYGFFSIVSIVLSILASAIFLAFFVLQARILSKLPK